MKMRKLNYLLMLIVVSCSAPIEHQENEIDISDFGLEVTIEVESSEQLTDLQIGSDLFSLQNISPHFFGRFYNERASYYVVDSVLFEMNKNSYQCKMILFFLDEILYKKTFQLEGVSIEDFLIHYGSNAQLSDSQIKELHGKRFFKVKLNLDDLDVVLKKNDFENYWIEEFHESYPMKLRSVKSTGLLSDLSNQNI